MKTKLRNVTVTLEEPVARWPRIEAARKDTSVSRLLGGFPKNACSTTKGMKERCAAPWAARLSPRRRADIYRARRPMTATVFIDTNVLIYALDRGR
jgi:hypothetical protein